MALPDPRIVSVDALRFRPANSNDRARAGLDHAFEDVPHCCFAKDDGISPYIGADAGIGTFPDAPSEQPGLLADVPDVVQESVAPALPVGGKILRSGFGLSIFLHGVLALGVSYATIRIPDDSALLEGETVIAIEFFSDMDSDATTRARQAEQDGADELIEQPRELPTRDVADPVKPIEGAQRPEHVEKPIETPEKVVSPVPGADVPRILSTTRPSETEIEAAARSILDDVKIEPLPSDLPQMLVQPVEARKAEPVDALAQPLLHPVSKPRARQKAAEAKPVEKAVARKEEPRKDDLKKPRPKPEKKSVRKKTVARQGNSDVDSNKGSSTAERKNGESQDASAGKSTKKVKGNASASTYKGLVQRKLERAKKRVRVAGRGKVLVSFTITANGSVVNLRVRTSSGKPAVDSGALDVVRRASPFPAIPPESGLKSYPVSVPMTFKGG